jgi:hypothetical protein
MIQLFADLTAVKVKKVRLCGGHYVRYWNSIGIASAEAGTLITLFPVYEMHALVCEILAAHNGGHKYLPFISFMFSVSLFFFSAAATSRSLRKRMPLKLLSF